MCLGPACAHTGQKTKGETCCRSPYSYAPSDGPLEVSVSSMKVVSPVPSSPLLLPQSKWNKPVLPKKYFKIETKWASKQKLICKPPNPPYSRVRRVTNYLHNPKSVTRRWFDLWQCEYIFYEPAWAPLQQRSHSTSFLFQSSYAMMPGILLGGYSRKFYNASFYICLITFSTLR